jgi:hypothetical protein
MPIIDEQKAEIIRVYKERFECDVTSVQDGVEDVFGGSLAIATYKPKPEELVSDVVYIGGDGKLSIFESTQELIMFLRQKTRFQGFSAFIDSKLFHAIIFIAVLVGVFWAGSLDTKFNGNALGILGSVVGLAAGLFFGSGKK